MYFLGFANIFSMENHGDSGSNGNDALWHTLSLQIIRKVLMNIWIYAELNRFWIAKIHFLLYKSGEQWPGPGKIWKQLCGVCSGQYAGNPSLIMQNCLFQHNRPLSLSGIPARQATLILLALFSCVLYFSPKFVNCGEWEQNALAGWEG